ncbi:hypothetical protein ABF226_002363 [Flavobacterium psychrophilum]
MKKIYLIQYKKGTNSMLEDRIKSISNNWIKYFDDNFIIESELKPSEIYNELKIGFEETNILVIEISKNNYYGRMNTSLWDWLKQKK